MKSLTLIVVLIFFGISTSLSQTETNSKIPTGKDFMFEVDLTPFTGDQIIRIEQFRGRYYFNEHWGIRLGFSFDYRTDKSNLEEDDINVNINNTNESIYDKKTSMIGISPGFEYRILANSKIAPYFGAEFIYQTKSSKENTLTKDYDYWGPTITKYKTDVDGAWLVFINSGPYYYYEYTERAYNKIGANLFIGSDFYFVKNFYFGFELGAGFYSTKYKDINTDRQMTHFASDGTVLNTDADKEVEPGFSEFSTGFYVINAIRIGVWF